MTRAISVGVGAAEAARRVLTDQDERTVLGAEVAVLHETGRAYACSILERAATARRAAATVSGLREV